MIAFYINLAISLPSNIYITAQNLLISVMKALVYLKDKKRANLCRV